MDTVDLITLENKVKNFYKLRKEIELNRKSYDKLRKEILSEMNRMDKKKLRLADYSVKVISRNNLRIDKGRVVGMIEQGFLPDDLILEKSTAYILCVMSHKDIKLEGNRFIKKKR